MMKSMEVQLESCLRRAMKLGAKTCISLPKIREKIEYVSRCLDNRSGIRLLWSCSLAKLDDPNNDPRMPYTEINKNGCFSGRGYDEKYLTQFINKHRLPCNATTAFLTPTLRNQNTPLLPGTVLEGRPKEVYAYALDILHDIATGTVEASDVICELLRHLLEMRTANENRLRDLEAAIASNRDTLPLSSEAIVTLLGQHLACKGTSRLPVLIVFAAYEAVRPVISENPLALHSHNAADVQTGAMGDIEIVLSQSIGDIYAIYEMKTRRVTREDIDLALQKIARSSIPPKQYVFITTEPIELIVLEYAHSKYDSTGTEFTVLDCIGFARHFLHFFHRFRIDFLDAYRRLVLSEPDSSIKRPVKEAFLTLLHAAITHD